MNQDAIRRYQRRSNIGIVMIFVFIFIKVKHYDKEPNELAGMFFSGLVICSFIWSCSNYAMSKGRHWAWGFLGIFGLIILVLLPRTKAALQATEPPSVPHLAVEPAPLNSTLTVARAHDERSASSPPVQDLASKFFLQIGNDVKGPYTLEQIRAIISVGTASLNTQCCKFGAVEWRPVSSFL